MPFAKEFDKVYATIKSAVEGDEVCFHCVRADEFVHGGSVVEDILNSIGRSEIIVADLTNKNPNVLYELGIAHTVKDSKKVIIISQDEMDNEVPFDLRSLRIIRYHSQEFGLGRLKYAIIKAFLEASEHSWTFPVVDGGSYKKDLKIYGLDGNTYLFGLSEVSVAVGGATFNLVLTRTNNNSGTKSSRCSLKVDHEMEIPDLGWKLKLIESDGRISRFGMGRYNVTTKLE